MPGVIPWVDASAQRIRGVYSGYACRRTRRWLSTVFGSSEDLARLPTL